MMLGSKDILPPENTRRINMKNKHNHRSLFSHPVFRITLALAMAASILIAQSAPASCAGKNATVFRTGEKAKKPKKTKITSRSVLLKWNKTNGATGYQIYRSTSKKGTFRKVFTTRNNYATDKKLTPGKTYFYKIRAYRTVKKKKLYNRFSSVLKIRTKSTKTIPSIPKSTATALPTGTPAITTEKHIQALNYRQSTERINNPDQGFYRPIYVRVTEDGVSYNKNIVNNNTQLYHLRIDISAFSQANNETADQPLTENALSGLDELLSFLYDNNKSAIARFVYDPGLNGASNKEPALDMILQHITQLSAVLDKYHDTLTAIEVGLIGPWGEMHTSTMANKDVINALIDAYLNHTTEIPILVRTPKMIYNYLGITMDDIDTYRIESTAKAYRLGLFNDGYLGSANDLGTYTNREKEVPWLALQNGHLPYGGEVVIPDSSLHDIENCLDEMFLLHLSYLNIEWNNIVIDKWKNSFYTDAAGKDSTYYGTTAFEYIENHMGYRFVLENSTFEYDETVSRFAIDLSLKNVGFGNLNRPMDLTLLLQSETGEITSVDAGHFNGQKNITFQTNLNLKKGTYNVYVKLDKGNDKYTLRFANDLWDEELQANQIGSFTKR